MPQPLPDGLGHLVDVLHLLGDVVLQSVNGLGEPVVFQHRSQRRIRWEAAGGHNRHQVGHLRVEIIDEATEVEPAVAWVPQDPVHELDNSAHLGCHEATARRAE